MHLNVITVKYELNYTISCIKWEMYECVFICSFNFSCHHQMPPHLAHAWSFRTATCIQSKVVNIPSYRLCPSPGAPPASPSPAPLTGATVNSSRTNYIFLSHNIMYERVHQLRNNRRVCLHFLSSAAAGGSDRMPEDPLLLWLASGPTNCFFPKSFQPWKFLLSIWKKLVHTIQGDRILIRDNYVVRRLVKPPCLGN